MACTWKAKREGAAGMQARTGRPVTGSSSCSAKLMLGSFSKCCSAKAAFLSIFLGKGPFTSIISASILLLSLPGNRIFPVKSS